MPTIPSATLSQKISLAQPKTEERAEKKESRSLRLLFAALIPASIITYLYFSNQGPNPALDALAETHPDIHKICSPILPSSLSGRIKNLLPLHSSFETSACQFIAPKTQAHETSALQGLFATNWSSMEDRLETLSNSTQTLYQHLLESTKEGSLPLTQKAAEHPKGLNTLRFLHETEGLSLSQVFKPRAHTPFNSPSSPTAIEAALLHNQTETLKYLSNRGISPHTKVAPSNEPAIVAHAAHATPSFFKLLVEDYSLDVDTNKNLFLERAMQLGNFELAHYLFQEHDAYPFESAEVFKSCLHFVSNDQIGLKQAKNTSDWLIKMAKEESEDLPALLLDLQQGTKAPLHYLLQNAREEVATPFLNLLLERKQTWEGPKQKLNPDTFEPTQNETHATRELLVPTASNNIFYQQGPSLLQSVSKNPHNSYSLGVKLLTQWEKDWRRHLGAIRTKTIYKPHFDGPYLLNQLAKHIEDTKLLTHILGRMSALGFSLELNAQTESILDIFRDRGRIDLALDFISAFKNATETHSYTDQLLLRAVASPLKLKTASGEINLRSACIRLINEFEADPTQTSIFEQSLQNTGSDYTPELMTAFLEAFNQKGKMEYLTQKDSNGWTPLEQMAKHKVPLASIQTYMNFLKKHKIEIEPNSSVEALGFALENEDFDLAYYLYRKGHTISDSYFLSVASQETGTLFKNFPPLKKIVEKKREDQPKSWFS